MGYEIAASYSRSVSLVDHELILKALQEVICP